MSEQIEPQAKPRRRAEDPPLAEDVKVQQRFVENVERLRRERGLSIERLADRSSVDGDVLHLDVLEKILRCERGIVLSDICKLAGTLDVKIDVLWQGIEWHSPVHGGPGWVITADGA